MVAYNTLSDFNIMIADGSGFIEKIMKGNI
jgi:hypothetical protein